MGLIYSIELYFPVDGIRQALVETINMANTNYGLDNGATIQLPDGSVIKWPFPLLFKREDSMLCKLKIGERSERLPVILWFPEDEAIREWVSWYERDTQPTNTMTIHDMKYAAVGYIYLNIRLGRKYARFDYVPASTSISHLFLKSTSIHRRFTELLHLAGGTVGVINLDFQEHRLLTNPEKTDFFIMYDDELENILDPVDRFAEAILKTINSE